MSTILTNKKHYFSLFFDHNLPIFGFSMLAAR